MFQGPDSFCLPTLHPPRSGFYPRAHQTPSGSKVAAPLPGGNEREGRRGGHCVTEAAVHSQEHRVDIHVHSIGWNGVLWLPLAARESGKVSILAGHSDILIRAGVLMVRREKRILRGN